MLRLQVRFGHQLDGSGVNLAGRAHLFGDNADAVDGIENDVAFKACGHGQGDGRDLVNVQAPVPQLHHGDASHVLADRQLHLAREAVLIAAVDPRRDNAVEFTVQRISGERLQKLHVRQQRQGGVINVRWRE